MSARHLKSLLSAAGLMLALSAFWAQPAPAAAPQPETMRQRITRFNRSLSDQPALWRGEPLMIAMFWAGPSISSERSLTYRAEPVESPTKAWVVITEEKLLDDAVAGSRVQLSFVMLQGRWELMDVQETWRCRRGPRTSGYTPGYCP